MIQSAEEFVKLRTSDVPEEYHRAMHETAPDEVWLEVIEKYPEKKKWVAHNKTVPLHILRLLAADPDPDVRMTVAATRRTETDLLAQLAVDPDQLVRQAVVFNLKTPENVLRILAHDPWDRFAGKALDRLRRIKQ